MYLLHVIFGVFVLSARFSDAAQFCKPYGDPCTEDYSCCGGCCLKGTCKDAYLDCRNPSAEDPCLKRHCPDDEVCVTYQPDGCIGCGSLPDCRRLPVPDGLRHNKTLTHFHIFNSARSLKLYLPILGSCLIFLTALF